MRVLSGTVNPDATVTNTTRETDEKLGGLFFLQGKEQVPAGQAKAGDIVATAKLKVTATGDTLCAKGAGIVIPAIKFPEPSISFAIEPKTRADEDKISQASHRIMDEDPTVRFERDPDTNQLLISGNGELHVRIITEKLKKRYNVDVDLKPPKISYKETIKGRADVQGRHKKQTGGRGQFGDVWIKMEPLPRGKDFEFEDKIFGGAIPRNFIPSVEKGMLEARKKGVLAGYPVVDFKVILYDGSYHDVDSSDIAFKIAASKAFKKAMKEAKPTILEPVMNVEVYTPEAYMGDIMGNLNGRRGKVQGMETEGDDARPQGRRPDVGDARLRAHPDLDHGRPRLVHDGVLPLRGSAQPHPAEDHRRRGQGRPGPARRRGLRDGAAPGPLVLDEPQVPHPAAGQHESRDPAVLVPDETELAEVPLVPREDVRFGRGEDRILVPRVPCDERPALTSRV